MPDAMRPRYIRDIESQEAGRDLGWHTHDFGQFFSAIRGSMYVGTRDRVLLLNPAMAVWIPPHADHWLRYVSSNEIIYVDVNRAEADKLGTEARIVQMTPLLQALMRVIPNSERSSFTKPHEAALYDLLCHEILAARDIPLSIAMPQDKRSTALAQAALDDPGSITSVDQWLSGASASRKTIERLFIAETGMPPSRWLRQVRILQAVSQLAAGKKISSVALDLGYQSPSAFTYMFRSAIGLSPRAFRQTEKRGGS
ncbi:helix-turn-helix domain-containing protein [Ochrobactrum sp. BTU1]|uniref:helix-turn-helix domain-containing protein n=1 Tax=Ochrobactrum sp. BTU1 TaxID=2840456 RepID=UPI001C03FAAC|nr:AraC family transcriptional regulator [Ochrobactrum sp. BTU1]